MNNYGLNITKDELIDNAHRLGLAVVPCAHNAHRVTLLGNGERAEAYSEGADTTIVWHTGKKVGDVVTHPMPWIVERLLGVLNLMEENV